MNEEIVEYSCTSATALPWQFLHKYFKVVGARGSSIRVQCLSCAPNIKLLYTSTKTWCNLMRHLKHQHPQKAVSVIGKRERKRRSPVKSAAVRRNIQRNPRGAGRKRTVVPESEPKIAMDPIQFPSSLLSYRDVKEELVSVPSIPAPVFVPSDSPDSILPNVDSSSTNFEYVNTSDRYSTGVVDVSSTQPQPDPCSMVQVESNQITSEDSFNISDINFLKSLLPDMLKMNPRQKHKFKLAILNVVDGLLYD